MPSKEPGPTILLADDDPFSCRLAQLALQESKRPGVLRSVGNGEELLDYLHRRGKYQNPESAPRPALILLDLNMPHKDGREALREIRDHPEFSTIPVVIMTSSSCEDDIHGSYKMGANSYITKPISFDGLLRVMEQLSYYWLDLVQLPRIC